MKRTPMKRSAWPARAPLHKNQLKEPETLTQQALIAVKSIARKSTYAENLREVCAAPIVKAAPVRSEAYRMAVASLPCVICHVPGHSQAAHGSSGKGMAIKACDMTLFPACCDRPGVRGCHGQLDQGAMFTKAVRHKLEPVWAADTQRKILAMGLWPKELQLPGEGE